LSLDPLAQFTDTQFQGFDRDSGRHGFNPVQEFIRGNGKLVESTRFNSSSNWYGHGWADQSSTDYFVTDEQGSVTALLDSNRHVDQQYSYDAFGTMLGGSRPSDDSEANWWGTFEPDPMQNHFGYNGKEYDGFTKLYNYGYRDYASQVGRFTTEDPIQAGSNWYVYVGNDPVNYTDPLGLDVYDLVSALQSNQYNSNDRGHTYQDYIQSSGQNQYFTADKPANGPQLQTFGVTVSADVGGMEINGSVGVAIYTSGNGKTEVAGYAGYSVGQTSNYIPAVGATIDYSSTGTATSVKDAGGGSLEGGVTVGSPVVVSAGVTVDNSGKITYSVGGSTPKFGVSESVTGGYTAVGPVATFGSDAS